MRRVEDQMKMRKTGLDHLRRILKDRVGMNRVREQDGSDEGSEQSPGTADRLEV